MSETFAPNLTNHERRWIEDLRKRGFSIDGITRHTDIERERVAAHLKIAPSHPVGGRR